MLYLTKISYKPHFALLCIAKLINEFHVKLGFTRSRQKRFTIYY